MYQVQFNVTLDLDPGKTLAVLGSTPELGEWNKKQVSHHMMWTKGNKWISRYPLETSTVHFRYKYVIMEDKGTNLFEYEKGIDKIADLDLQGKDDVDEIVYLYDIWQMYRLKFSVFTHIGGDTDQMVMDFKYHKGDKYETMTMERSKNKNTWLNTKYGGNVVPWECYYDMENLKNNEEGDFQEANDARFSYRYRKVKSFGDDEAERDPMRFLHLHGPGAYEGVLGKTGHTQ